MTKPIVFLGSDDAAAACLAACDDAGLLAAVVTPPPARRSRSGATEPSVAAVAALARGLPVIEAADVNADSVVAQIAAHAPRLLVVVSFGQIMKRAVRDVAPLGAVNLHYSLLPRWRGAAPVQRAILAGDPETGAAVQRVVARLDAGAVLAVAKLALEPTDDTASLRARLTAAGAPLLVAVAKRLLAGESLPETEQDESLAIRAAPIDRSEGDLDPAIDDAVVAVRKIRAFTPWPRCRLQIVSADGRSAVVTIHAAQVDAYDAAADQAARGRKAAPREQGEVLCADGTGIVLLMRAGALRITALQRAGGKVLAAREFLNGWPVRAGDYAVAPDAAGG